MAYIHHVQLRVQNGLKYLQKFTKNANFELFASRTTPHLRQWAVRSGNSVFLITDKICPNQPGSDDWLSESDRESPRATSDGGAATSEPVVLSAMPDPCFLEPGEVSAPGGWRRAKIRRDTVFNVAFEVRNVKDAVTRAEENGARVLVPPTVIQEGGADEGHVTVAAVRSCVGNVVHTLVDTSAFAGVFLPGFVKACDRPSGLAAADLRTNRNSVESGHPPIYLTDHIDHVTFACPIGSSAKVIDWYEKCFGMKRFLLTREENEAEGFVVQGKNVGLRLKAMEYWHCAETGLTMPRAETQGEGAGTDSRPRPSMAKFVIAEALPGYGPNQVETFLQQHEGAGIQHIGLHTHNIILAVSALRRAGLSFMVPPDAYYTEVGKLEEIKRIREDVELLQRMGILLDEESGNQTDAQDELNGGAENGPAYDTPKCRYLMQVFTRPIFEQDTFFLELIHRQGATGFGAGNIRALWRSVQTYMDNSTN